MMESLQSVAMIFLFIFAVINGLLFLGLAGIGVYEFWQMYKDDREDRKRRKELKNKDKQNRI